MNSEKIIIIVNVVISIINLLLIYNNTRISKKIPGLTMKAQIIKERLTEINQLRELIVDYTDENKSISCHDTKEFVENWLIEYRLKCEKIVLIMKEENSRAVCEVNKIVKLREKILMELLNENALSVEMLMIKMKKNNFSKINKEVRAFILKICKEEEEIIMKKLIN